MTERVIKVTLDDSEIGPRLSAIEQQLGGVQRQGENTQRTFSQLRGAVVAVIGALGVRELGQLADRYTSIQNRLRLVTEGTSNLNTVQDELIELSRGTRTSFESTVELYSRAARATEDLGLTQRETLEFTESINQAIRISGATAEEGARGTIQLAQALQGGTVRAEEFNAIVEQTPRLAEALADGLGVTRGELRQLVVDGELSSRQLIDAITSQADVLEREFGTTVPTLEEGFTALTDSVLVFVGSVNEATGTTGAFGEVLFDTSGFILEFAEDAAVAGATLRAAFTDVFAEIGAELSTLDEQFALFQNTTVGVIATIFGDTEVAAAAAQARVALERELADAETEAEQQLEFIRNQIREQLEDRVTGIVGRDPGSLDDRPGGAGAGAGEGPDPDQLEDAAAFLEQLRERTEEARIETELFGQAADEAILRLETAREIEGFGGNLSEEINEATEALIEQNRELARANELRENQADDTELVEGLREEVALLRLSNEEREVEVALRSLSADATDIQKTEVRELVEELQRLRDTEEEARESVRGFLEDISGAVGETIFDGFRDGFDDIETEFANFLQNLAQQLFESALQEALFNLFNVGAGGGSGGGFIQGVASIFAGGFQDGGTIPAGQVGLVGEDGPEFAFGAAGGTGIAPLDQLTPTIVIVNEQDPEAQIATLQTRRGVTIQRNRVTQDRRQTRRTLGLQP